MTTAPAPADRAREIAHGFADSTDLCVHSADAVYRPPHSLLCNTLTAAIDAAIQDAVDAERERCELIVLRNRDCCTQGKTTWLVLDSIATAIRQPPE